MYVQRRKSEKKKVIGNKYILKYFLMGQLTLVMLGKCLIHEWCHARTCQETGRKLVPQKWNFSVLFKIDKLQLRTWSIFTVYFFLIWEAKKKEERTVIGQGTWFSFCVKIPCNCMVCLQKLCPPLACEQKCWADISCRQHHALCPQPKPKKCKMWKAKFVVALSSIGECYGQHIACKLWVGIIPLLALKLGNGVCVCQGWGYYLEPLTCCFSPDWVMWISCIFLFWELSCCFPSNIFIVRPLLW